MPDKDPDHWLYRLSSEEWLRAADNELARAELALVHKQQRMGVAGARRAAGMAWNAVLVVSLDEQYGRSYMEHLSALAKEPAVPEEVRAAAQALVAAPLQTNVVPLGKGDTRLAEAARTILRHARERVSPAASA
jgi:HEPN domain-containing protein